MLTIYIFKPKTSIRSRKAAIDSTFIRPLYKRSISINYRVFYTAAFYIFTTSFQRRFYLKPTYFIISVVDFYLYQYPSISFTTIVTLYQYSTRSSPSALATSVPYFLFLLPISRGLPSQYTFAHCFFRGASLLTVYTLAFNVHFPLLSDLIL